MKAITVCLLLSALFAAFVHWLRTPSDIYIEFDTPGGMHCVKTVRALSCIDNREYAK